jgi:hypothetical protein
MLTLRLSSESAMNVISFCSSGLIVTVMSGLANPTAAATSWPSGGVGSAASGLLSRSCLEEKKVRSLFLETTGQVLIGKKLRREGGWGRGGIAVSVL